METALLKSPLGILEVTGDKAGIASIYFKDDETLLPTSSIPAVLQEAAIQLEEYFLKKRTHFNLKLNPQGTDFQKKVWGELSKIPYGKPKSYMDMAKKLGDPKVIRAAASANGKNPISIVIPCHRVIGSDQSLTGYAGGVWRKKWLLDHESPVIQQKLF